LLPFVHLYVDVSVHMHKRDNMNSFGHVSVKFFRWIAFGTRKNLFALGMDLDYVTDTGYKYNNLVISSWSPCEGLFPVFAV